MKTYTKFLIPLFIFLMISAIYPVNAIRPNYVYDRANILTTTEENSIQSFCRSFDEDTTVEIVIITLSELGDYGTAYDAVKTIWTTEPLDGVIGIGNVESDNGVMLLVAIEDREWWIGVDKGVEGDLTDGECGRIGRGELVPEFKNENYYEGILATVKAVSLETNGNYTTYSDANPLTEAEVNTILTIVFVIGISIVTALLLVLIATQLPKWLAKRKDIKAIKKRYKSIINERSTEEAKVTKKLIEVRKKSETYPRWARIEAGHAEQNAAHLIMANAVTLTDLLATKLNPDTFDEVQNKLNVVKYNYENIVNNIIEADQIIPKEIRDYTVKLPDKIKDVSNKITITKNFLRKYAEEGFNIDKDIATIQTVKKDFNLFKTEVSKNPTYTKPMYPHFVKLEFVLDNIKIEMQNKIKLRNSVNVELKNIPKYFERITKGIPEAERQLDIIKQKHPVHRWEEIQKNLIKGKTLIPLINPYLKKARDFNNMKIRRFEEANKILEIINNKLLIIENNSNVVFNLKERLHRTKNEIPSLIPLVERTVKDAIEEVDHNDVGRETKLTAKKAMKNFSLANDAYSAYTGVEIIDWISIYDLLYEARKLAQDAINDAQNDINGAKRRRREEEEEDDRRRRDSYSSSSWGSGGGSSGGGSFGGGGFGGGGGGGGW